MSKQETFRRLLAGEYDDAHYVMVSNDLELLEQMREYGWFAYSRPLVKWSKNLNDHQYEGSPEWRKDIKQALRALQRV